MLKIGHLKISRAVIYCKLEFQSLYTLMLLVTIFEAHFISKSQPGQPVKKVGKARLASLRPRWRVWESQHRQHIRDPELLGAGRIDKSLCLLGLGIDSGPEDLICVFFFLVKKVIFCLRA